MANPEAAMALASPVGLRVVERRQGRLPPFSGAESVALVFSRATAGMAPLPLLVVEETVAGGAVPFAPGNLTSVGDSTIGRWTMTPCSFTSAGAVAALAWFDPVLAAMAMSGRAPFLLLIDLFDGCLRSWYVPGARVLDIWGLGVVDSAAVLAVVVVGGE